jgi:hypothetical protein
MASDIVNAAHTDLNRHASMLGVIGSLGTADVKGSALTLPIGVNPLNGAMYVGGSVTIVNGTADANVEARKQTPTGNALNVQIGPGDPIHNIPVVMDFEHHQIHEGETYKAEYADTGLDTNTVKFGFTAGSYSNQINAPHMVVGVDIYNGAALVQIYEGGTIAGGTALSIYNRNRASTETPTSSVKVGITSTNGTLIDSFYVGAGKGNAASGRPASEWVLKSQTIYRVDVTGQAVNTDSITSFNWYEDLGI